MNKAGQHITGELRRNRGSRSGRRPSRQSLGETDRKKTGTQHLLYSKSCLTRRTPLRAKSSGLLKWRLSIFADSPKSTLSNSQTHTRLSTDRTGRESRVSVKPSNTACSPRFTKRIRSGSPSPTTAASHSILPSASERRIHKPSMSIRTRVKSMSSAADIGATRNPRWGIATTRLSALSPLGNGRYASGCS